MMPFCELDPLEREAVDAVCSHDFQTVYFKTAEGLGQCHVAIRQRDARTVVVVSEADDNGGDPIDSLFEEMATHLWASCLEATPPASIEWLEHFLPDTRFPQETIARVTLRWDAERLRFHSAEWARVLERVEPDQAVEEGDLDLAGPGLARIH